MNEGSLGCLASSPLHIHHWKAALGGAPTNELRTRCRKKKLGLLRVVAHGMLGQRMCGRHLTHMKILGTSALLVVTGALLVITRSY